MRAEAFFFDEIEYCRFPFGRLSVRIRIGPFSNWTSVHTIGEEQNSESFLPSWPCFLLRTAAGNWLFSFRPQTNDAAQPSIRLFCLKLAFFCHRKLLWAFPTSFTFPPKKSPKEWMGVTKAVSFSLVVVCFCHRFMGCERFVHHPPPRRAKREG